MLADAATRPDHDPASTIPAGGARSTTGAARSCWPRRSTATCSWRPRPAEPGRHRRTTWPTPDRDPRPRPARRADPDRQLDRGPGLRRPGPRPRPGHGRPDPQAVAQRRRLRRAVASSRSRSGSIPQAGGAPDTTLAAQLLGFVNRDGVGQYGVEQYYQDELAGQPKVVRPPSATRPATPIPDTARSSSPGHARRGLRLTIDAGLQLAVEQELLAAWVGRPRASRSPPW